MAYTPKIGDYYRETDGKIWVKFGKGDLDWQNSNVKGNTPPRNATGIEVDRVSKQPDTARTDAAPLKQTNSGNLGGDFTNYARYPSNNSNVISNNTDYVLFQFSEYKPPFKNSGDRLPNGLGEYNQSVDSLTSIDLSLIHI